MAARARNLSLLPWILEKLESDFCPPSLIEDSGTTWGFDLTIPRVFTNPCASLFSAMMRYERVLFDHHILDMERAYFQTNPLKDTSYRATKSWGLNIGPFYLVRHGLNSLKSRVFDDSRVDAPPVL